MPSKVAPDAGFSQCDGYLFTKTGKDLDDLRREAGAAREAGVDAELTTSVPLPYAVAGAVQFRNQAQIHPRRYLLPLIEKIAEAGSLIFERTKIADFEESDRCTIATEDGGSIVVGSVVVAANVPATGRDSAPQAT